MNEEFFELFLTIKELKLDFEKLKANQEEIKQILSLIYSKLK
jgi:hypothetical protein